jgi:ribosomal protein L37E
MIEIATRSTALRAGFLAMTAREYLGVCGYCGFPLTAKLRRSIIYIKLTESEE